MHQAPEWSPVPQAGLRAPPQRAADGQIGAAWILFAGAVFVTVVLYPLAVSFIDQPAPETTPAAAFFVLIILTWIPTIFATQKWQSEGSTGLIVLALALAALPAVGVSAMQEGAYGFIGFVGIILFAGIPLLVLTLIGLLVALIQRMRGNGARAIRTVHLVSLWLLGVVSMTSLWLLITLPRQAELARAAHEVPAPALVLIVLAVAAVVFMLARRR